MRTVTLDELRALPAGTIYSASSPGQNYLCQIGIAGGEGFGPEGWFIQPGKSFDEVIGPKHFPSRIDHLEVLELDDLRTLQTCVDRAIAAL